MPCHLPERPSEIAALFAASPLDPALHAARADQLAGSIRGASSLAKRANFAARQHRRVARGLKLLPAVAGKNGFDQRAAAVCNARFAVFAAAMDAANDAGPAPVQRVAA